MISTRRWGSMVGRPTPSAALGPPVLPRIRSSGARIRSFAEGPPGPQGRRNTGKALRPAPTREEPSITSPNPMTTTVGLLVVATLLLPLSGVAVLFAVRRSTRLRGLSPRAPSGRNCRGRVGSLRRLFSLHGSHRSLRIRRRLAGAPDFPGLPANRFWPGHPCVRVAGHPGETRCRRAALPSG